jgi:hypothetical protein
MTASETDYPLFVALPPLSWHWDPADPANEWASGEWGDLPQKCVRRRMIDASGDVPPSHQVKQSTIIRFIHYSFHHSSFIIHYSLFIIHYSLFIIRTDCW